MARPDKQIVVAYKEAKVEYVSKSWMLNYIHQCQKSRDYNRLAGMVGRALVTLWERQTIDEQVLEDTRHYNERGFSKPDAKEGTEHACYFQRTGALKTWMLEAWLRPWGRRGLPRICKYSRQLNEVAIEKRGVKRDLVLENLLREM